MWSAFVISLMIGLLLGYLYGTKSSLQKIADLESDLAEEKQQHALLKQKAGRQ